MQDYAMQPKDRQLDIYLNGISWKLGWGRGYGTQKENEHLCKHHEERLPTGGDYRRTKT